MLSVMPDSYFLSFVFCYYFSIEVDALLLSALFSQR